MKPTNERTQWHLVSKKVDLVSGTAVRKIIAGTFRLVSDFSTEPHRLLSPIFFDWQEGPPDDAAGLLQLDRQSLQGFGVHVLAALTSDPETLREAERRGLFRYMPEGWYTNPGSSLDNIGAAADPRIALTLALINDLLLRRKLEQAIQQKNTHGLQIESALGDGDGSSSQARTVLRYLFSTVGAMGNGTLDWLLSSGARQCAKAQGVPLKVVLNAVVRGTLATHDDRQADLNQCVTYKHLRALVSGCYVNSPNGGLMQCPFDLALFSSNRNNNGNIPDLDHLLAHEALADFYFWHTSSGKKLRERLSDHERWVCDEYGDPRFVFTRGCAAISWDSGRVSGYCAHRVAALLDQALQSEGDPDKVRKQTAALARLYELVESDQENQVTGPLLRSDGPDNELLPERMARSLADRVGGARGLPRALAAVDAVNDMRNADIPTTYEPLITRRAQAKLQTVIDGLAEFLDACMGKVDGLWQARQSCALLKALIENSQEAVLSKIHGLQELMQPHEEVLAEGTEQLQYLQERGWLGRAYNSLLIRGIGRSIYESGQVVLGCQLQIAACRIASQEILTPLIEHLDRKLVWLSQGDRKLHQVGQSLQQEASRVASQPVSLHAALGLELVTKERLEGYLARYVGQVGGQENLVPDLLGRLLTRHGSLASLLEASAEECQDCLVSLCEEVFQPLLAHTDVVAELKELYPDSASHEKILDQTNRQSEGRLATTGEVNQPVVWLKVVSVPSTAHAEWVRGILEKVDKKAGKWDVAVHPDRDRIVLLQLRGDISITPMIKYLEPPDDPDGWAQLISRAPDPVSALTVGPNPSLRQFKRVLAKAIITEQLTVAEDGTFVFSSPTGEPLPLGKDPRSVRQKLRPNWPYLVFVESTFGRNLVVDGEGVMAKVGQMHKKMESAESPTDPRLSLIDATAAKEALKQAELILPWARRIQKANLERLPE